MNKLFNSITKGGMALYIFLVLIIALLGGFLLRLSKKITQVANKQITGSIAAVISDSSVKDSPVKTETIILKETVVREMMSYQLPTIADKIRGVFYIPRLSPAMDFWQELKKGTITFDNIEQDLVQLKSLTNLNTIRVFTYYDYEYRNAYNQAISEGKTPAEANLMAMTSHFGWTDGQGNHNNLYLESLKTFVNLCKSKGIDVIVTMFQELPALKNTDNWNFLENDIAHYQSFTRWFINGIKDLENVKIINLINEPDGYGVWNDESLAARVLVFLDKLKATIKEIKPELLIMITSTTHDNNFCRFPAAPVGCNSIYELTDIVSINSFLFADSGFRSGVDYKAQFEYLVANNKLNKPAFLSECGFPSHYAQQEVDGYEIVNEDGTTTDVVASSTRSSIVPIGGIFDRPKGTINGVAHSLANQKRGINEAFYWAERFDFMGGLVWSAYDHSNPLALNVYRDAFGIIDKNGVPSDAVEILKNAFQDQTDKFGKKHISLVQGEVFGNGRINGLIPYDYVNPSHNTPNGVFLHSDSVWQSDNLPYNTPITYNLSFKIREAITVDEVLVFSLVMGKVKVCDWRYKKYDRDGFQKIDPNGEVDFGFSQPIPMPVNQINVFTFEINSLKPKAYFNGIELIYENDDFSFQAWMLSSMQLKLRNISNSNVDILGLEVQSKTVNQALIRT